MLLLFSAWALLADHLDDDRAVLAGVGCDPAQRLLQRAAQDLDAGQDVAFSLDGVERRQCVDQGDATTGDDAFFNRGAGGAKGVLDAVLLLLQLGLGGCADLDDRDAAGQLRQPLLQFLAVEVAMVVVSIWARIWSMRPLIAFSSPTAFDDGGVVLGGDHAAGAAEVLRCQRCRACGRLLRR